VTVNDPAGDALKCTDRLLGGRRAGTPACHGVLNAVTHQDALLAGTTKQGRVGSTCIEDCLVCVYYLRLSLLLDLLADFTTVMLK